MGVFFYRILKSRPYRHPLQTDMTRLLKAQVKHNCDEVKRLMLAGEPFQKQLYRLYEKLRADGKYTWTAEVYRLLLLCASDEQKEQLLHPALLQAFMALGQTRKAHAIAAKLLRKNPADPETRKLLRGLSARAENTLPPYTPLAALSSYAAGKQRAPRSKTAPFPSAWENAAQLFSKDNLQKLGYFDKQKQFARAPRARRAALTETFDELVSSYLLGNYRASAALAGAMLETLLALHIRRRKKKKKISVAGKAGQHIFDLTLYDLAACCAEHGLLTPHILKLIGAARGQRNFIHPGKALLEQGGLTPAGARVCLLAVLETADEVL